MYFVAAGSLANILADLKGFGSRDIELILRHKWAWGFGIWIEMGFVFGLGLGCWL